MGNLLSTCGWSQNVYISSGKNTLTNGLKEAKKIFESAACKVTIHLEAGIYEEDSKRIGLFGKSGILIDFPVTIIGAGPNKTFVEGSLLLLISDLFHNVNGNATYECNHVTIKDLTVRKSDSHGLFVKKLYFTCINVNFTECSGCGVKNVSGHGKLIDCEITKCGGSGIVSPSQRRGLTEVSGRRSKVTENCTEGKSDDFGLQTLGGDLIIHPPLTKESISTDNGGGGNWGGKNSDIYIGSREEIVLNEKKMTNGGSVTPSY